MSGGDADQKSSSFISALYRWSISNDTPSTDPYGTTGDDDVGLQRSQGQDHTVTRTYRMDHYPKDCPPLRVRWFYAVDSPKRKPVLLGYNSEDSKPLPLPKKFVPFSVGDSQSIETAFQGLIYPGCDKETPRAGANDEDPRLVPVNEDYLFDVDVQCRELKPAYWNGPVYEVRRGTWFIQEGSTLKPCEENLATQLEQGFLKTRPWRTQTSSAHQETARNSDLQHPNDPTTASANAHSDSYPSLPATSTGAPHASATAGHNLSLRLFGVYMNSIVTYQDASAAWLTSDDFVSRMSTTVYQKFGGVAGTKVIRGFTDLVKGGREEELAGAGDAAGRKHARWKKTHRHRPRTAAGIQQKPETFPQIPDQCRRQTDEEEEDHPAKTTLERQMSSLAGEPQDMADLEEQARRQAEKEMEDSGEIASEDRERQVDHLVLVVHGIGQRLGLRLESVNFVHDVNSLRKTMKSVYKASPGLQTLNSSFADSKKNCRVQVLPV